MAEGNPDAQIVDAIRHKQRDPIFESSLPDEIDLEEFDGHSGGTAPGKRRPRIRGDPESALGLQQFSPARLLEGFLRRS
jgi:hypothetical protein